MLISGIVLLLIIHNLQALNCYSNGSIYFSRNEFHSNDFSEIINQINHPIISDVSSCHVRITVDYNQNEQENPYVTMKFSPIEDDHLKTTIEFGSTIHFLPNDLQTIVSYLDYRCSTENLCDKNFLQRWPREFLNTSENSLHRNLISAWKSNRCEEQIRTNYCESYLCFHIYNELKDLSYGESQCAEPSSTNPVNIHIKTKSGKIYQEYQCRKNQCTGEILYDSLLKKNSAEELQINAKEKYVNQLIWKRAMITVGILLVIGSIAYAIQCRKYKQGYRLTRNA